MGAGIYAAQQGYKKLHEKDEKYQKKPGALLGDSFKFAAKTGGKILGAQAIGNITGALTGTSSTRSMSVKGKYSDKGKQLANPDAGTGLGGHRQGDFASQIDAMKKLGENIAMDDTRERMDKKAPKSNE